MKLVKLTLKESDEYVFVNPQYIVAVAQARAQAKTGPPMPVLGVSLVTVFGAPPMAVVGTPQAVSDLIGGENGQSLIAN